MTLVQLVLHIPVDQLGRLPGPRERQGLGARLHGFHHQPHGIVGRAAPRQLVRARDRGIPQGKVFTAARCTVFVHQHDLAAQQTAGQIGGVGDRGAGGQEHRSRAVVLANPLQPPQHTGHVGPQDAAIGVDLVDHDIGQLAEKAGPLGMVGQQRGVQHVWIGQDQIRLGLDAPPLAGRRVAVVDAQPDAVCHPRICRPAAPGGPSAGPEPGPWWGTGTVPGSGDPPGRPRARAGCSTASCRWRCR